MTNVIEIARLYKTNQFKPFPLSPMKKEPYPGISLYKAGEVAFKPDSNIGLFMGSANGLAVIDADNEFAVQNVSKKLMELGLYNWTTIVMTPKRKGLHFWLRIVDVPKHAQAYYKLVKHVGGGEIRLKMPAYVVAPGSELPQGKYTFVQGGIEYFCRQPALTWKDLTWLLPPHAYSSSYAKVNRMAARENTLGFDFVETPPALMLFEALRRARQGQKIQRIDMHTGELRHDAYPSRSEAEASIVAALILAGWNYDQISERFEMEQPGHYVETKNPERYLVSTYNKALEYISSYESPRS